MTTVLLIEDGDDTVEEISGYLSHRGYTIERVADGEAGLAGAFQGSAEVLIVDRMLPLLDGLTVLIRLRQDRIRAPAIVLSALAGVDERVDGLRAGGDDYLVKPFVLAELEALVRRRDIGQETMLRVGPLHLDLVKRTARRGGREIENVAEGIHAARIHDAPRRTNGDAKHVVRGRLELPLHPGAPPSSTSRWGVCAASSPGRGRSC